MTTMSLRPVTKDNLHAIVKLTVSDTQKQFVAPNVYSLAEAALEPKAWPRAIYADETPVGFLMMHLDTVKPTYYLWRFMIGADHQGKGYGYQALHLLIEYVRRRPQAREMTLSYVPGEGCPQPFYQKLGFVDTGEVHEDENVMKLELDTQGIQAEEIIVGPINHQVMFKLKEASETNIAAALTHLRSLDGQIPSLRSIRVGADLIHSPRSYDIGLIATFDDIAGLQAYQAHPVHLPVLAYMREHCSHIIAVDYEN
ncbi:MAG: GNAT family N-acetyltransferase [Candidatus Promineifilaceae bacterium]